MGGMSALIPIKNDPVANEKALAGIRHDKTRDANDGYDGGWVYDPKVGKSFSVAILLTGRDELSVTGYKGVKLLGKTFIWKRAKTELPSCAAVPVEAKADPAKKGGGETLPWAAAKPANAAPAPKPAKKPPATAPAKPPANQ